MNDPIDDALHSLLTRSWNASYYEGAALVCGEFPRKVTYWDRGRGLIWMAHYLRTMLPEMFDGTPRRVLELGPGSGHFLEYAREAGHEIDGVDCYPGGEPVKGYKLMAEARGLPVAYVGFHRVMTAMEAGGTLPEWTPDPCGYDLIHAQRSLGGIVSCHENSLPAIPARRSDAILRTCHKLLAPHGLLQLSHNDYPGLAAYCEEMSRFPGFRYEQINAVTSRLWKV